MRSVPDPERRRTPGTGTVWENALPVGIGVFLGLGMLLITYFFAEAIAVLVFSAAIADALAPLTAWLERFIKRSVAVALLYILLLGVVALLAAFVWPAIFSEAQGLVNRAPELLRFWNTRVPDAVTNALSRAAQSGTNWLVSVPLAIGSLLATGAVVFFLSFYWLLARTSINSFIRSLFPAAAHSRVDGIRSEIDAAMGGYLRGVFLNAVATGTLACVGLVAVGVNYPLALGLITACGEFIPYLGPILAAIPAVSIAFLQSPGKAAWALAVYVAVQQIEGHLLTPNIMRSQTDIPQVLVILALFAGGAVGGVLGAIVSVPIAGLCHVLVRRVIAPAIRTRLAARA